jgi:hypothetical protein
MTAHKVARQCPEAVGLLNHSAENPCEVNAILRLAMKMHP